MKKTEEVFVVERSFDDGADLEQLQEMEKRAAWCLSMHRVTFLRTYLSADKKRMICMYTAPDAEAVRVVQRQSGLPYDRVWAAGVYEASPSGEQTATQQPSNPAEINADRLLSPVLGGGGSRRTPGGGA